MAEMKGDFLAYQHTQKGPWSWLLFVLAVAFFTAAWCVEPVPGLSITFLVAGMFMLLIGACLGHLTVSDEGNQLAVCFGPLPLFQRRVWYDDILKVEKDRTTFLDGWGIHWSLRGGWVWNIWGRDCVLLRLRKGILRIGTDDVDNLTQFLQGRIGERSDDERA